jgi:hypothetical protein
MQSGQNVNVDVPSWRDWDKDGFKKKVLAHYMQYLQQNYGSVKGSMAGPITDFTDGNIVFTDVRPS